MKKKLVRFFRFSIVGGVGFAIDGGLVWSLVTTGVEPVIARLFSFPSAVAVTWWLNRTWTFDGSEKTRFLRQLRRYFVLQIIGALANFVLFATILAVIEPTAVNALFALAAGAVVGMIVNFVGSYYLVFTLTEARHPNSLRDKFEKIIK